MKSAGYTLLETVIAIAILIGGAMVVYSSSAHTLAYTYNNQYRLTASYLVQEGVEIVRNIRDRNWLAGQDWRQGLEEGVDYQAQYNSFTLSVYTGLPLLLSSTGLYNYNEGEETIFCRKINIDHQGEDKIKVTVEVSWLYDQGQPVRAETFLYNWY
jgi:type II secretory pathway pseudopilin PulG